MADPVIICPHCKGEVPLSDAFSQQMESARLDLDKQMAEKLRAEKAKLTEEARKRAQESWATEVEAMKAQLAEKEKTLEDAKKQESVFRKQKLELEQREKLLVAAREEMEKQVSDKVKTESLRIEKEAQRKAQETSLLEMKDLKDQIAEKNRKLQETQQSELTLRKQQRELEEKQQAFELEMNRKLDAERNTIREDAAKRADEAHRLKEAEKDKQLSDLRQQIEQLKTQQSSQQLVGEVAELDLEKRLKAAFPLDVIDEVPKGVRGADVVQRVCTRDGQVCGAIVWESKNTKGWSDSWITKLKEDQLLVKADLAVLMSITLPRHIHNIGCENGIWVSNVESALGLATALRTSLIQLHTAKRMQEGKSEKMEQLYQYFSSSEYRQRVELIVGSFLQMKEELEKEKVALTKIWAKREKQLDTVLTGISAMNGQLQALMSNGTEEPPLLSLDQLAE